MPSGLIALLDDVATIAKLAAASLDDVAAAAGKAGTKTAGILIDDTAVTPRYVHGLSPDRELPIIAKITVGSLRNKLLFLLPAAILLSEFASFLITPLLMLGGAYLAFEATEKILETLLHEHRHEEQLVDAMADPGDLERLQVKGAIRTDFILSAEIMAISLANLDPMELPLRIGALALIAVGLTLVVYGAVALIVKLDDIGLHLAGRENRTARAFGDGLVHVVPTLLSALSTIGTAAMLWVGGGILLHGLEELHIGGPFPQMVEDFAEHLGEMSGAFGALVSWLVTAIAGAIVGLFFGSIVTFIVRQFHKRPEELIVD